MAIRSKPRQTAPAADERAVEAFIGKGGATPESEAPKIEEIKLQIRTDLPLVNRIDRAREARYPNEKLRPSRHTWLLEAIIEKLEREEGRHDRT